MIIRESRDQLAFNQSPGLIAVFHALHRLLAPRHPPHALSSLAALIPPPIGFSPTRKKILLEATDPNNRPLLARRALVGKKVTILFILKAHAELFVRQLLPLPNCQRTKSRHDRWAGAGAFANAAARTQFFGRVETTGIEPATSGLQNRRSPN